MKNFYKFSATWCGSCKIIQPKWKEVKNEYSIQEIIDITKDAYRGYMFHDFFTNTNT